MSDQPQVIRREDYTAPAFLVEKVELVFELDRDVTNVKSRLFVHANPVRGTGGGDMVHLDGEDMKLVSIAVDDRRLGVDEYSVDPSGLSFSAPGETFVVDIETQISPAANTRLEGLYVSQSAFCTQCEAEGFRRITYFPDRPDVMATYKVTIHADKASCPVLLSNGNLIDSGDLDGNRHYAVWEDPFPKPSYLFALVAGDLACVEDSFKTMSGRNVALRIFVEHGNEDRCDYAMDSLKRSMKWDEEVYGLEYDLDLFNIVAVSDFNMGAMENKSLNVFNAKYILAKPDTATDTDYELIESIVAHEYFHNWSGNRVTCRDWFQLSLKEGLTVFRDQEFSADQRSRPVQRIKDVAQLRARQFPEDGGPLAHPVRPDSYMEINNFYTATVYEKGAELIRMMHTLLGAEGYRKGIDLYFDRHDGQAVTCDDFARAMEDANDVDLSQLKIWYSQAGTPSLSWRGEHDTEAKQFRLTVSQKTAPTPGQPDKVALHMPIAIGLLGRDGRELVSRTVQLTEAEQTFVFDNIDQVPVVSFNRGFSAPVNIATEQPHEELVFLMGHDSDAFNRWEAGQKYATALMLSAIAEFEKNGGDADAALGDVTEFVAAMRATLINDDLDKAFRADALVLPGEEFLSEQRKPANPDAIHQVRNALRKRIGSDLRAEFGNAYHQNASNAAFTPDAESAGQRALRATALAYLVASGEGEFADLAAEQYRSADNMTDRMAALSVLNHLDHPGRAEALADFEARFGKDTVVMDKWFGLQAMSSRDDTLSRVKDLMSHPLFTMRNPNKVRSLIGAFAMTNPRHFHAADGSGYAFYTDRLIELDDINPQVAARLCAPLGKWAKYDEARADLMKAALDRILAKPDISRDLYEIASKSRAV
ncbi:MULTISPECIES: aminopeptidase N [Thalassospira]|jgi:aminopeptidase N|uniref:Aminopeptidase N n=2 Tax=Thalassospira xiamenensis TaxID=220697 RepID=A0ABR5XZH7_9PROT|nr:MULTISPECIES: aminopeptidase N [Thalassospira]MBL4839272.1 aminopeptidase N [Thalassospira sp.]MBR9818147.1 aminopeptidase N [Rhodospirillales bacterium]KZD01102.1 aminopeptidase N [Thalassospira xiamenensis]KZD06222.1 aminopeptidase N [Thalassospira xiamenensis]MCD1596521.1 aminopeptidase N [Thalassospira xiamenensis]|tara:strand:- start:1980 stop:4607 length:2628 start_codon:yes stop_codon:yes gene_type:complete